MTPIEVVKSAEIFLINFLISRKSELNNDLYSAICEYRDNMHSDNQDHYSVRENLLNLFLQRKNQLCYLYLFSGMLLHMHPAANDTNEEWEELSIEVFTQISCDLRRAGFSDEEVLDLLSDVSTSNL